MLSRPTTEQILLDCCRELMTVVLPALTDETAQVSVIMVETVLRNTAVRAAHEVAWMREETAEIESYAHAVAAQAPGGPFGSGFDAPIRVPELEADYEKLLPVSHPQPATSALSSQDQE